MTKSASGRLCPLGMHFVTRSDVPERARHNIRHGTKIAARIAAKIVHLAA